MTRKTTTLLSIAAAVTFAVGVVSIWERQQSRPAVNQHHKVAKAQIATATPSDEEIEMTVRATGLAVDKLVVRNVGGVVVIRGEAADAETATKVAEAVKGLGVQRVANLVRVPQAPNDQLIRQDAERALARARSLDGCRFEVSCRLGVLKVAAKIQSPLQEDAARSILRAVPGVQRVELEAQRF